ncbi:MAG: NADPH-dependent FMN reductase [Candidatus Sericytochromatia bacterium]
MNTKLKILALAASNSPQSINRELVARAAALSHFEATVMDLTAYDEIPIYSTERQQRDGFPPEIQELYTMIQAHDGLMIASPEHNGSMPAVFKNVIDWLSRINMKFLSDKPLLLLSTSPGPRGGSTNLEHLAKLVPWWGAQLTGTYSLGNFYQQLDRESGKFAPEAEEKLQSLVAEFEQSLLPRHLLQAA